MGKYHVKSPAKIGGQIHKPGAEPIELDDKKAAPLVKSGSLAPHVEKSEGPDPEIEALMKVEVIEDCARVAATLDTKKLEAACRAAKKAKKAKDWLAVLEAELEKRKAQD